MLKRFANFNFVEAEIVGYDCEDEDLKMLFEEQKGV